MRSLMLRLLSALCLALPAGAQEIDLTLTLEANTTPTASVRDLHFGLDPCATSALDNAALCNLESELPPLPPAGVFEARWVDTGSGAVGFGNGSASDYRTGGIGYTGTEVHVLRFQPGDATQITFSWNLLPGATGTLEAIGASTPFSQAVSGTGSVTWTIDPFVSFVRLTMVYDDVLPVELTSFSAVADRDAVWLQWETASETNNAGFEVQHASGSGAEEAQAAWTVLGFVEGAGTTLETRRYAYQAAALAPGVHRFRLRQVDYDGAFEYSPVVEVRVDLPGTHVLSEAYPNPFNPQAAFTLAVAQRQHVRITVHDALGRRAAVLHDGILDAGATHRFVVDGAGLPSGTYLLRVEGASFRETRKLVLAK